MGNESRAAAWDGINTELDVHADFVTANSIYQVRAGRCTAVTSRRAVRRNSRDLAIGMKIRGRIDSKVGLLAAEVPESGDRVMFTGIARYLITSPLIAVCPPGFAGAFMITGDEAQPDRYESVFVIEDDHQKE